ncbi:MAG: thioesterase family protein [Burkholderiales bacterium]|nr:thioesterase family protein [Burkholderiales bacterium]
MKPTLQPGLTGAFRYTVPPNRTVPHLYPEAADFQVMPGVLATGYLVGLCEWACIDLIRPHLDWPAEQSLGTRVNFSHVAATPPGMTITVSTRLTGVHGRKLSFEVSAHDGMDLISEGTHERHIIDAARFNTKVADKLERSRA